MASKLPPVNPSIKMLHRDKERSDGWYATVDAAPRFDFNDGRRFNDLLGYDSGKRALCVRRFGE